MAKRFALTPEGYAELKRKVLKRDSYCCRKCKSRFNLHVHHVIFRSDGGGDISSNLIVLCQRDHDAVHGKIQDYFLVLAHKDSDLLPPNTDEGVRWKTYSKVQRRLTWRIK